MAKDTFDFEAFKAQKFTEYKKKEIKPVHVRKAKSGIVFTDFNLAGKKIPCVFIPIKKKPEALRLFKQIKANKEHVLKKTALVSVTVDKAEKGAEKITLEIKKGGLSSKQLEQKGASLFKKTIKMELEVVASESMNAEDSKEMIEGVLEKVKDAASNFVKNLKDIYSSFAANYEIVQQQINTLYEKIENAKKLDVASAKELIKQVESNIDKLEKKYANVEDVKLKEKIKQQITKGKKQLKNLNSSLSVKAEKGEKGVNASINADGISGGVSDGKNSASLTLNQEAIIAKVERSNFSVSKKTKKYKVPGTIPLYVSFGFDCEFKTGVTGINDFKNDIYSIGINASGSMKGSIILTLDGFAVELENESSIQADIETSGTHYYQPKGKPQHYNVIKGPELSISVKTKLVLKASSEIMSMANHIGVDKKSLEWQIIATKGYELLKLITPTFSTKTSQNWSGDFEFKMGKDLKEDMNGIIETINNIKYTYKYWKENSVFDAGGQVYKEVTDFVIHKFEKKSVKGILRAAEAQFKEQSRKAALEKDKNKK